MAPQSEVRIYSGLVLNKGTYTHVWFMKNIHVSCHDFRWGVGLAIQFFLSCKQTSKKMTCNAHLQSNIYAIFFLLL